MLDDKSTMRLAMAVLQRAIDDYQYLLDNGKDSGGNRQEGFYNLKELMQFFTSDFGKAMIKARIALNKETEAA